MYKTYDGLEFENKTDSIWHNRCIPLPLKYAYTNYTAEELNKESWYVVGYNSKINEIKPGIQVYSRDPKPIDMYILKGTLMDVINYAYIDDNWTKQKSKYIMECGQDGNATHC